MTDLMSSSFSEFPVVKCGPAGYFPHPPSPYRLHPCHYRTLGLLYAFPGLYRCLGTVASQSHSLNLALCLSANFPAALTLKFSASPLLTVLLLSHRVYYQALRLCQALL